MEFILRLWWGAGGGAGEGGWEGYFEVYVLPERATRRFVHSQLGQNFTTFGRARLRYWMDVLALVRTVIPNGRTQMAINSEDGDTALTSRPLA